MARGRRKGGIDINTINDNSKLTNMIINQINSLNKKIKAFNNKGIEEQGEYIHAILNDKMATFTDTGTISKSKKFYEGQNTHWLKKTLSALVKINNHNTLGTVKKYEKEVTETIAKIQQKAKQYLQDKGYSEQFIQEVINDKDYITALLSAFNNKEGSVGSKTVIEKIALSYKENDFISDKEKNKILSNLEYSKNALDEIDREKREIEEARAIIKARNSKKR